jgi:hypothetical protein
MKVIAINDAPTPKNGYHSNGVYLDRAYYKGDIFDSYETFGDDRVNSVYLIIWHDKLGAEMEVDSKNFIKLEEHRNQQLDKIL